jgi:hypothetical protein
MGEIRGHAPHARAGGVRLEFVGISTRNCGQTCKCNSHFTFRCSQSKTSAVRKPRLEIQGGLYHIITRGNNRQLIFGSDDDYRSSCNSLTKRARLPSTFMPTA